MFGRRLLSNSRCKSIRTHASSSGVGRSIAGLTKVRSLTAAQAQQVAGGCSNPHGCAARNEGVAVVTMRQPALSDFEARQVEWRQPLDFAQEPLSWSS